MPENQNIEYKSTWRDEYLKWICGFANASGGKLMVGVDDHGIIHGIDNEKELLEQLPNKFRDILGVFADVNLYEFESKKYIEIIVPRYDVPISVRGKYYVRKGSTLQELSGISLNEFLLTRTGKTWDNLIEERASIDDIDEKSIEQFVKDARETKRISIEKDIRIYELLDKLRLNDGNQIKRAGIILFGKDPGKFYPNLAIKIGKFGNSDADLKYHEVLEGNIIQLKEEIGKVLNTKFFIHPIDFSGMQRIEQDEYPVAAVREMILNALVHRTYMGAPTQIRLYDNHFSIWNDGGLPESLREEDLKKVHPSKPRNPLIADVCFKGGYIDAWGRGTLKIIDACKDAGLPDAILKEKHGGFMSRISKNPEQEADVKAEIEADIIAVLRKKYGVNAEELRKNYGRTAEEIIAWINEETGITMEEIANNIGKSQSTIEKHIKKLREAGVLERIGSTKSGEWKIKL